MIEITGNLFGIREVNKALRTLPDDMRKELNKDINAGLTKVREAARANAKTMELRGWRKYPWKAEGTDGVALRRSQISSSLTIDNLPRRAQREDGLFARRVRFSKRGVAGAIIEFAGAGGGRRAFGDALDRRYGKPGRILFRGWEQVGAHDQITRDFEEAIMRALDAFTKYHGK